MAKALKYLGFILSLLCLGFIVYLSLLPQVTIPDFVKGGDKSAHFLAYMALGFLLFLCFSDIDSRLFVRSNLLPLLSAFALSSLCGYALELFQPVFGRCFEQYDLLADFAGSFIGCIVGLLCVDLIFLIERRNRKK